MYQNEISELPRLPEEKYENIFQVYQDKDNRYFYNLLQNINLPTELPDGFFEKYTIEPGDTLPFISYKLFNTIDLWWVICLSNNIENPTLKLEPGKTLKIFKSNLIQVIISEINQ
jgi:hypothetical protein